MTNDMSNTRKSTPRRKDAEKTPGLLITLRLLNIFLPLQIYGEHIGQRHFEYRAINARTQGRRENTKSFASLPRCVFALRRFNIFLPTALLRRIVLVNDISNTEQSTPRRKDAEKTRKSFASLHPRVFALRLFNIFLPTANLRRIQYV